MNAPAPPGSEADRPDTSEDQAWNRPAVLASQWLAYSLLHLATGPAIPAHDRADTGTATPLAAMAGVVAETWEIEFVDTTSEPLLDMVFSASPAPAAALVALPYAVFHALQAAQALVHNPVCKLFPALDALPAAFFTRLKSNLELELAGQHSVALDQWFASLAADVQGGFFATQQTPVAAACAWAGIVHDYLSFSLFHLLKALNAAMLGSHLTAHFYIETVADEGMVLASARPAQAIAQYLIETRELALAALLRAFPILDELQDMLAAAGKGLQQALPQPLQAALALALPSERFLSAHAATDFAKELLTAVAVAIPVVAAGIHLLPRMIDAEGLAFAMLKQTATNVLIDLAGRSALPLGAFLSEKSWLAVEGAQQLASTLLPEPDAWTRLHGDSALVPQDAAALVGVAEAASLATV